MCCVLCYHYCYVVWRRSAIAKSGASIVSPIPSLSAHIESYGEYLSHRAGDLDSHEYVSLYHDWFEEAARLLESVKGMEWNLWTLVAHYKSSEDHHDDRDNNNPNELR